MQIGTLTSPGHRPAWTLLFLAVYFTVHWTVHGTVYSTVYCTVYCTVFCTVYFITLQLNCTQLSSVHPVYSAAPGCPCFHPSLTSVIISITLGLYSVHCTVYSTLGLYCVQCTVYSTLDNTYSRVCTVHFILLAPHSTP